MTRIVAYVPDLLDRSRLARLGDVRFLASPEQLTDTTPGAEAVVVVLDLSRPGVLEVLPALAAVPGLRSVGFASHVDRQLLSAAREAGCDEVFSRSTFFSRLGQLLGG